MATLAAVKAKISAASSLEPEPNEADQVLSMDGVRRSVGVVGFALPVVLFASNWFFGDHQLPGSMSAFYYTPMRNYFVGTMFALGVFLFSYRYAPRDTKLSTLAAVMAIVVGLCPTAPKGADHYNPGNILHLATAWLFLILVGVFAFHYFPKQKKGNVPTPRKLLRNKIYRVCGALTIGSMLLALLLFKSESIHILFWLETVAVWAFSFAWVVKGGLLLRDEDEPAPGPVPLAIPAQPEAEAASDATAEVDVLAQNGGVS